MVVVTSIALTSLCLAWSVQAAPIQWNTNYPSLKDQLYKSIISRALVQQEGSPSTKDKDKEMAATFCKLLLQALHSIGEKFIDGSVDDYCNLDFELPPEPRPEDKSSILADAYKEILSVLKKTEFNGYSIWDLING